jgi:hypothetical protein
VGFLAWLETTGFAAWVQTSTAGYPFMITAHAVGMAMMVGVAFMLDMRLLGMFQGIQYAALGRFLGLARTGFAINFLSGAAIFTTQATVYATDATFITKIVLVLVGAATAVWLGKALARDAGKWAGGAAPGAVRLVAALSIVCWVGATVTGRLIAYL